MEQIKSNCAVGTRSFGSLRVPVVQVESHNGWDPKQCVYQENEIVDVSEELPESLVAVLDDESDCEVDEPCQGNVEQNGNDHVGLPVLALVP